MQDQAAVAGRTLAVAIAVGKPRVVTGYAIRQQMPVARILLHRYSGAPGGMIHTLRGAFQPLLKRLGIFTQIMQPALTSAQAPAKYIGIFLGESTDTLQMIRQGLPISLAGICSRVREV